MKMNVFLAGLIIGMLIMYSWINPDAVKMLCNKLVAQIKKLLGRK